MTTTPNSEMLQLLMPNSDPELILESGRTVTLSGLLDQVPFAQAMEMLKIYHLQSVVDVLQDVRTRLTIIAERLEDK